MSDLGPITPGGLSGIGATYSANSVTSGATSNASSSSSGNEVVRGEDSVQFSDSAKRASQEEQPVRNDLVSNVKADIAAGTYETDERLEGAIDNLMKDLFA